ncbi:MAG: HpcH/HpaI aldolase/citrate lyase family protein [Acidimicrobiia bacterium]
METLREQWVAGRTTMGGWLSVPSSVSAEAAARVGFDFVCVDTQHGAIEYQTAVGMLQAIALGAGAPIVRVPWNEPGIIGKMLDAGAEGVIVPMVNSAAEAEAVVRACRYAPAGSRSWGPSVTGMRHSDYFAWARDNVAVIPMIETVEALGRLDEILSTPGVDAIYVGPADLSVSLGLPPGNNDDRAEFTEALVAIVAACRNAGVVPGIHASGALSARRLEQGFQMITVANDLLAIRTRMADELNLAHGALASTGSDAIY